MPCPYIDIDIGILWREDDLHGLFVDAYFHFVCMNSHNLDHEGDARDCSETSQRGKLWETVEAMYWLLLFSEKVSRNT
jgi:hypothetical protein